MFGKNCIDICIEGGGQTDCMRTEEDWALGIMCVQIDGYFERVANDFFRWELLDTWKCMVGCAILLSPVCGYRQRLADGSYVRKIDGLGVVVDALVIQSIPSLPRIRSKCASRWTGCDIVEHDCASWAHDVKLHGPDQAGEGGSGLNPMDVRVRDLPSVN